METNVLALDEIQLGGGDWRDDDKLEEIDRNVSKAHPFGLNRVLQFMTKYFVHEVARAPEVDSWPCLPQRHGERECRCGRREVIGLR